MHREVEYYMKILSKITSVRDLHFADRSGGDSGGDRVVTLNEGLNVKFTLELLDMLDWQTKEIESLRGDKARLDSRPSG